MTRLVRPLLLLLVLLSSLAVSAADAPYLYRVTLVQASPGKLLELVDFYRSQSAALQAVGDELPLWMRHSQGDHWDLMLLWPMSNYSDYYAAERVSRRQATLLSEKTISRMSELISWQEDLFCFGPPLGELRKAFAAGGYFHVEMFQALPGQFRELYREREMENAYSRALGQPQNFIFTRDQGAAWDLFTIGVFRDLKHYASSSDASPEAQQAAAKAAGFESPAQIGPYLRRFIRSHHDTLAVAVK